MDVNYLAKDQCCSDRDGSILSATPLPPSGGEKLEILCCDLLNFTNFAGFLERPYVEVKVEGIMDDDVRVCLNGEPVREDFFYYDYRTDTYGRVWWDHVAGEYKPVTSTDLQRRASTYEPIRPTPFNPPIFRIYKEFKPGDVISVYTFDGWGTSIRTSPSYIRIKRGNSMLYEKLVGTVITYPTPKEFNKGYTKSGPHHEIVELVGEVEITQEMLS